MEHAQCIFISQRQVVC